jgi:hypothetical protein
VAKNGGLRWVCDHLSGERAPMTPLTGGDFRVGERGWSPERLRFDTIIDGLAQRALLSGAPYTRTFT